MTVPQRLLLAVGLLSCIVGCGKSSSGPAVVRGEAVEAAMNAQLPAAATAGVEPSQDPAPDSAPRIVSWGVVEEWTQPLAVMESVFWEPDDTASLRKLIRETDLVRGKSVLEIGTGSGLAALCCLRAGAQRVVATDINPNAIRCAAYNARELGLEERLELRPVRRDAPGAFAVIAPEERFDLIISNPPWEDAAPQSIAEFALYDQNFALMQSLFDGLAEHLRPGGRALLAYGCVDAIRTLERLAAERGFETRRLDDRDLETLEPVFLPGMLIEVRSGPNDRTTGFQPVP